MIKEMRIAIYITLLAALLGFAIRTPAQQSATNSASVLAAKNFIPFTLETRTYFFSASSTRRPISRQIVARRSDGTTVTLRFQPDTATHFRVRVIQYLEGRHLEIYDDVRAFVRWPAPRQPTALQEDLRAVAEHCLVLHGEYLEKYTALGGMKVAVIRSLPKGSSGMTSWLAPELGCQELQQTFTQVQADGSFHLVNELKFVSLKLGEPETAYFSVPSTFASLTPSVALREEFIHNGIPWNSHARYMAARIEAAYERRQSAAKSSR